MYAYHPVRLLIFMFVLSFLALHHLIWVEGARCLAGRVVICSFYGCF